jgi:glutamate N-acetyltransferase/amino-acid N-acetyltransferase
LRAVARERRQRRDGRRGQLRHVRRRADRGLPGTGPRHLRAARATKLVQVNITGAASAAEARKAAKVIANSLLVKTAIHGGDPNWGRLICAAGRAGVTLDATRAGVTMGSIVLFKDGQPHDDLAPAAAEYLKGTELTIGVDLGAGSASSTVWTCDLSAEYVRINADYRT